MLDIISNEAILSLEDPPEFIPCMSFVSFSTQASLVGTELWPLMPLHPPSLGLASFPAPNQSSSHVVFESSSHVASESSSNVVFESSSQVVFESSSQVVFEYSSHVKFESSSHVVFQSSSHVVFESSPHVFESSLLLLLSTHSYNPF